MKVPDFNKMEAAVSFGPGSLIASMAVRAGAIFAAGVLAVCSEPALSHDMDMHGHEMMHMHHSKPPACEGKTLNCASAATATFAADGTLWLVWAAGGYVSVAKSKDLGQTFSTPSVVNAEKAQLDTGADARPKIALDNAGRILVTYSIFKDNAYNGEVFYASSADGGLTFSAPRPITANTESQRFEVVALNKDGKLFAAWLDKRGRAPARARGEKYVGADLAFAWASPDLTAIGDAAIAHDNTCECCRIGVAFTGDGRPAVVFRNIFPGSIRDHAVMTFENDTTPGPIYRVSDDNWKTDVCPHQGPSLAIAPDGSYHVAWYTDGSKRSGLFYAHSADGGKTFSTPLAIGNPDHNPSRPSLLATPQHLWLAWKEFDGQATSIFAMVSDDHGGTWSKPREIAKTQSDADLPFLVADKAGIFLSWLTQKEGYHLYPLEPVL
jgi:hypothetical protein